MSSSRRLALLGLLGVAACGPLPQPFRGRPGAVATRLARPPGYRIAVPPPTGALLADEDARRYATALTEALAGQDVPVADTAPLPLDWQLLATADRLGGSVVPRFALRDSDGHDLGGLAGRPVPARDWGEGLEPVLRRAAAEAAPELATLIARADAQRRTGDERAAGAGPPLVAVLPVRGAPGDGNQSLTLRMRERMAGRGFQVQDTREGAQFAVTAEVTTAQGASRGQQRVEIVWTVSRRDGFDLGRVVQLNEVPAGSLNGLWGDVAFVVAEEASGGVRDVIANAGGLGDVPPPAPPAPAPAAATPVSAAAAQRRAAAPVPQERRR